MYEIIRSPVITEKATLLNERNQVVFRVAIDATKPEIKAAVEGLFGVKVAGVNTLVAKGKTKRFKGRPGVRSDVKKAYRAACRGSVDRPDHRPGVRARAMALKQFNPVTPSLRGTVLIDRSELYKGKPVKGLTEGKTRTRRAQQPWPHHQPLPRRRAQAELPDRRFQAPQVRRAGGGGAAGIRSEPHRVHRADQVSGRRAGLYPGAAAAARRAIAWWPAPRVDIKPGNAMPLAAIPVGTIIHNIEMKPGAGGKMARAAGTYAQLVGKDAGYAQIKLMSRRAARGARRVHGDDRRGVERRTTSNQQHRQGRAQSAGSAGGRITAAW